MQDLSIDKQILIAINEIFDKRKFCAWSFAVISMLIVSIGLVWPKTYKSSTSIFWNKSQVIKPLLEGTAVTSTGKEQAQLAKEVIYSNRNLDELIRRAELDVNESGWKMSDREVEILKADLRKKIIIERGSNDILNISYKGPDPEEAYLIVSIVSKLFIEETTLNNQTESIAAYDFIKSQVNEYQQKLNDINARINDFKSENIEIQVETSAGVNVRISGLKDQIKATELELKEAIIRQNSLMEQLEKESHKSTAEEAVNVKNVRLQELENRLSTLRLSYTETYPDVIQLKEQIKLLSQEIEREALENAATDKPSESAGTGSFRSALYNRLKQQVADQETVIKTLEARKLDQQRRFDQEIGRSSQVNFVVSKLEELSRDRAVTKQLYDQLLAKLENARVSLSLEQVSAASLFKIQEPPIIPLVPEGLRFLHFAIGSVVLGFAIPIGLVVGILLIDPRIRHEDVIDLGDDIPVIGVVPIFRTRQEVRKQKMATVQSILIVLVSIGLIAGISISRYYEVI